jgi:hypothetical protein
MDSGFTNIAFEADGSVAAKTGVRSNKASWLTYSHFPNAFRAKLHYNETKRRIGSEDRRPFEVKNLGCVRGRGSLTTLTFLWLGVDCDHRGKQQRKNQLRILCGWAKPKDKFWQRLNIRARWEYSTLAASYGVKKR